MPLKSLHPGHVLFVLLLGAAAVWPDSMEQALDDTTRWFAEHCGWLVMLSCSFFVVLSGYLAFGRFGSLKLGDPDEPPQFSTLSWLAMLFAAGMGSGLIFYGAAEPYLHYQTPPPSADNIAGQAVLARQAMAITFFHWGIHAWVIYAIAALGIAYFAFHHHTPMLPSAAITHNMRGRYAPSVRRLVDSVAILGVVFGLVASMSQAVLQLSEGLADSFLPDTDMMTLQLVLLLAMFLCYSISASTSIGRGIRMLSNVNVIIAVVVMLFILFVGPTLFVLDSFVTAIGDYLDHFVSLSFNMRPHSDAEGWTGSWTITYFLWWIAWGPFVGVFIARISRGRTVREFMLGVVLVPTMFSALWFAVLGGTALHAELFSAPGYADGASPPEIIFRMLALLPLDVITPLVVLGLLFIFLITSADSGTYVLGMFTREGELTPPVWERLFWGAIVGLTTAGAILSGRGTDFFRAFAVVGSIPYLFVMLWQTACLWRQLQADANEG